MAREIIQLRTSERTSFGRCRFAWDIAYNERLRPKLSSPPLRFGTLIHKAMELRYPPGLKRGPHPAKTFAKLFDAEFAEQREQGFTDPDGTWEEMRDLGIDMLNHYVDQYGTEDEWKVISSEVAFQVKIRQTKDYVLEYVGILDAIWEHRINKDIVIRDWKTAKAIPATQGNHLVLDEQPGSYWSFAPEFLRAQGILKPKQKLRGIDFFYMRKAKRDPRPRNSEGHYLNKPGMPAVKALFEERNLKLPVKGEGSGKDGAVLVDDLLAALPKRTREHAMLLGEVSSNQPADYFKLVPTIRSEAEQINLRHRVMEQFKDMQRVRAGKSFPYKNPSQMSCGMCAVRQACELHEAGQDWVSFASSTLVPWDPYSEHEVRGAELR